MADKITMRVAMVFEYQISGDPAERIKTYGTDDPAECAKIDEGNDFMALVDYATLKSFTITPVED